MNKQNYKKVYFENGTQLLKWIKQRKFFYTERSVLIYRYNKDKLEMRPSKGNNVYWAKSAYNIKDLDFMVKWHKVYKLVKV